MNLKQVKKYIFKNEDAKVSISSGYGERVHPITGEVTFHYGIDYATYGKNLPLYPITRGRVVQIGKDSVSGNYIFIKYPTLGIESFYCHMKSKPKVKKNQLIEADTLVGYVGTTGSSTGEHLHLGIKKTKVYVDNEFTSWRNPADIKLKTTAITKKETKFRKKCTYKSKLWCMIPKGEEVEYISKNVRKDTHYTYSKIKWDDKVGYVVSGNLK